MSAPTTPVAASSAVPSALPPEALVSFDCQNAAFDSLPEITLPVPATGLMDFGDIWTAAMPHCDVTRSSAPFTALEAAAYKTAKYTDGNVGVLYELCAEVDPDDVYAQKGFVMSDQQIPETIGALMLCPKQPHAAKWRQAIVRGQAELKLEKAGRTFGSGVYLVGKEIKPGTYVVTGDIANCYWERQNRNGGIIANDFVLQSRRVQVTIRSSDYAFSSSGCGTWKPA